jgi:hypothetical protein
MVIKSRLHVIDGQPADQNTIVDGKQQAFSYRLDIGA